MDIDVTETTVASLQAALRDGSVSARDLLAACVARVHDVDRQVGAVLALHPDAERHAEDSDARLAAGTARPLEGVPVLVKDNVAVTGLPTTAGSRALAHSSPSDAPLVMLLREAGAVVMGKTNLSEWANFRSTESTSGWSGVGGQTRNPHVLDRDPSGSSSGSAAAVAAGMAPLAVGTETDGSIVSPAGMCGVVGLKPGLGVVPGSGIVPISSQQDVAGPMARTVADAAALFTAMSAVPVPTLTPDLLSGARLGVWSLPEAPADVAEVLDRAARAAAGSGATLVPVTLDQEAFQDDEWTCLVAEFRHEIDAYLAAAPGAAVRSLAELVAFNRADSVSLQHFGQDVFESALDAPPLTDKGYLAARAAATARARATVDDVLREHALAAVLTLTNDAAGVIDYAVGSRAASGVSTSGPAAVAGYPSITVPGGFVGDLPIGVSLFAGIGTEVRLLGLAHALEQANPARRPPRLLPTSP